MYSRLDPNYYDKILICQFASILCLPQFTASWLTGCEGEECIAEVLKRYCEIGYLNLAYTGIEVFEIENCKANLKICRFADCLFSDN